MSSFRPPAHVVPPGVYGEVALPCGHCGEPLRGHRLRVDVKCARCHKRLCNHCPGDKCPKELTPAK